MVTYINGKFLAQRVTGTQRAAWELVQALDTVLADADADADAAGPWVLLCPPGVTRPTFRYLKARTVGLAGWSLHVWEQVVLPWAARRGLLVNLAGPAPLWAGRQVVLIHDAAVFDHPEAYTAAFGAWYRFAFRRLARHAMRLLTVSAFSQDRLALALGLAPDAIGVLHHGSEHFDHVDADPAVLVRARLQGVRFLLAVASDNPTKNLDALVAAYGGLRSDAELRLVIVGGAQGRVFAPHQRPVDPRGVLRLGPVNDQELKALYGAALALVFPSTYEGFGLPPVEATACGCPVAVARAASLPEVCGDAALYFDPHCIDSIRDAMQRLLDDAPLREALRERGQRQAATFRWAAAARALMQALRSGVPT